MILPQRKDPQPPAAEVPDCPGFHPLLQVCSVTADSVSHPNVHPTDLPVHFNWPKLVSLTTTRRPTAGY